jgi:WD40 repeat protein
VHERDTAIGLVGQLSVNNGLELAAKDDAFGALSWFAQALNRDHDNPERAQLHRIRLGLHVRTLPKILHSWQQDQPVTDAEFSPDGRWVVTASGVSYPPLGYDTQGEARVWDAVTGEPVSPALRHEGTVYSAAFSPDGTRVLTAGGDGKVRIWAVKTGKLLLDRIRPGGTVRLARFSSDGSRIATAGGGAARVWDAHTETPSRPSSRSPTATCGTWSSVPTQPSYWQPTAAAFSIATALPHASGTPRRENR